MFVLLPFCNNVKKCYWHAPSCLILHDCNVLMFKSPLTCPCHSMVLMRMMLSGRRSSEMRIWFSWSYTDFLGTFDTKERQRLYFHMHRGQICGLVSPLRRCFTCAMSRESGEHSLSMLLVLSLWALEFCRSFMEVLRGRLCSLFSTLLRTRGDTRCSKYTTERAGNLNVLG